MEFKDSVVLVTGASRGLGAAFATYLAHAGATVAINSTGANSEGATLCESLIDEGYQALYVPGQAEDAQQLVEAVLSQSGRLDAIVHNAGFVRDKTIRKMTSDQWDEVLNLHLKASFQLAQAAWEHFENQRQISADDVDVILNAMSRHIAHEAVQAKACSSLAEIAGQRNSWMRVSHRNQFL